MTNFLKYIPGTLAHTIEKEKRRAAEREENIRRRSADSGVISSGSDDYGAYSGLAAASYAGYSGDSCSSSSDSGGGDGGGGGGCD